MEDQTAQIRALEALVVLLLSRVFPPEELRRIDEHSLPVSQSIAPADELEMYPHFDRLVRLAREAQP